MNFIAKGVVTALVGVAVLIVFQITRLQSFHVANLYEHTGIDPSIAASALIFLVAGFILASGFTKTSTGRSLQHLRLWWLTLQDFRVRSFRNLTMMAGVGVVIGVLFLSFVLTTGAAHSTDVAIGRAGADLIVVPQGTVVQNDLFSYPFSFSSFMDRSVERHVASIQGVEGVSSHTFLGTVKAGGGCGALQALFFIAINAGDPFVIAWSTDKQPLKKGQTITGSSVASALETLKDFFGWKLERRGALPLTGTYADHQVFVSTETAEELVADSGIGPTRIPLTFQENQITTVYVKVNADASVDEVADSISTAVKDVTVIKTSELGSNVAKRLSSLLSSFTYIGSLTVGVSVILVSSLSSVTVNEKRREIGVLRSLGASKYLVSKLLTSQILLVTLFGGVAGIVGASLALYFNYVTIIGSLKIPFIPPGFLDLVWAIAISLTLAAATGVVAGLYPAYKASRMDPYEAIRKENR